VRRHRSCPASNACGPAAGASKPVRVSNSDICIEPNTFKCTGIIEYWDATSHAFPGKAVSFGSRLDTDLYALAKAQTRALSLAVSCDGAQFAAFCADRCRCPSPHLHLLHMSLA